MFKKLLSFIAVSAMIIPSIYAQVGTVSGTVYDARTGEELPGVNIFISELARGAATDVNGNYTIEDVPFGEYNVRISFIGYKQLNQTLNVNDENLTLNFELSEDLVGLEELIVTGQGSGVERSRLSTNVTTISANQMERLPTQQMDQLLQANIPNSQIRISSGNPGSASLIRGRGVTSAFASTSPVVYVDGVRVDNSTAFALNRSTGGAESSAIADIPVENIERIEFLSGGAATTQFGSDAANGVIQIFTKRGVQGASNFAFQTSIGTQMATKDFLRYERSGDILFDPGITQEYRLSGSGGTSDFTYSFSGSMKGAEGVLEPGGDSQERYAIRAGFNAKVSEIARYDASFGYNSTAFERPIAANFAGSIFDVEGGSFGNADEWTDDEYEAQTDFIRTYVGLHDITEGVNRFQTSQGLNFNFNDNLSGKTIVGLDYRNSNQQFIYTNEYNIARGFETPGTTDSGELDQATRNFLGLTLEASLRHEYEVGDFSFITNVGTQLFRNDDRQVVIRIDGLPDGSLNASTGQDRVGDNFRSSVVNYGVYALENISYNDIYVLEFGVRVDQNTAFGEEVGAQVYPKLGATYNISNESFFSDIVSPNMVSTLRLRGNIGYAGNFPTPFSNEFLATSAGFRGAPIFDFGTPGDSELKPEITRTIEVGGDISFINDQINLQVTYYDAVTNEALFSSPLPPSSGLGTPLRNLGTIENSGFEVAGNFSVLRTRDASLSLNASFNTLNNEITDNGGTAPFNVGGFAFLGSFVDEGKPVGYFRGNRMVLDENDQIVEIVPNDDLGSPLPDYFGNLGLNADYKGLSLTVTADWQMGAQGVWPDELLRHLSGLGDGRVPDHITNPFFDYANLFVEDADFLKVRLISLNYTLPTHLYANVLKRVSVGATATNPLNFVSSNFDPEIAGAGITPNLGADRQNRVGVGGFAYGQMSANRQFFGTVKIDF